MKDWIALQKHLYEQVKRDLNELTSQKPKALQSYEAAFEADLKQMQLSSWASFVSAQQNADRLFLGDFHSFHQSQKQLLRLLENPQLKKPKSLGLEILPPELEADLHQCMKRPSTKKWQKFRKDLQVEEVFGSSFEVYQRIFESAHRQNIKLFSLGKTQAPLHSRDKEASRRILEQEGPVWVFMGEFHCARSKLPALVSAAQPKARLISLQQNADRLALRYISQMESSSSLLFESRKQKPAQLFCLIHTLPWVKWQSDLNFKLQQYDQLTELDPHDHIRWSFQTLQEFFKDPRYPKSQLPQNPTDFTTLISTDEAFMAQLKLLTVPQRRYVLQQLELNKVAILYRERRVFLAEVSLNSCAQAAASLLLCHWRRRQSFQFKFYKNCLDECLSFFLSKVLNHRRKSPNWSEWKQRLQQEADPRKLRVILDSQFFYKSLDFEHNLEPYPREAAHALGRWIADQCFEAFLAGELSKQRMTRLLTQEESKEERARLRLLELYSIAKDFG